MSEIIQGPVHWCKVLGQPRMNKFTEEREWSVDVSLTPDDAKNLRKQGCHKQVRNKGDERGDFVTFRRKEFKRDGITKNQPIRVKDMKGQQWPDNVLIGNGSICDIRFKIFDTDFGKSLQIEALRVRELVPYETKDFPDEPEPNRRKQAAKPAEDWNADEEEADDEPQPVAKKKSQKERATLDEGELDDEVPF